MQVYRGFILFVAVVLAFFPADAKADCCAEGRVQLLVYGGQFGYRGGTAVGRTAQPFAGVANPRYALAQSVSNQTVGGPMASAGPSRHFARRQFVNVPQLQTVAELASLRSGGFDSDAHLLEQPDGPKNAVEPDGTMEPEPPADGYYSGQNYYAEQVVQRGAYSEPKKPAKARSHLPQISHPSRRTAPAVEKKTLIVPGPIPQSGAFGSESSSRVARSLRVSGLDF